VGWGLCQPGRKPLLVRFADIDVVDTGRQRATSFGDVPIKFAMVLTRLVITCKKTRMFFAPLPAYRYGI